MSKKDFFNLIGDSVLADAIEKKILPSLTLAQAALEGNFGDSELASIYNNHFGIKGEGNAGTVSMPTIEYVHGVRQETQANFAAYKTIQDGIAAHTKLFRDGVSWNPEIYHPLYAVSDYKEAARTVQECGYATDPAYADKLISIIEKYDLQNYDAKYWAALFPPVAAADEWKVQALDWLKNCENVSPPIDGHQPDEMVTFAQLGSILSRIVRK